ncbi:MAG: VOC family protein [Pseudomonadota bacterium]
MTHRSRLGVVVIDCETDDLTEAAAFWSAALGRTVTVDADGQYAQAERTETGPRVLLQRVGHAPRVHIDIETDDREAEVARLEALGAKKIDSLKGWHVMEAPTGHRFCIVKPQTGDFPGDAATWD